MRFLSRTVRLPVNNPKSVANCDKVKCASCQFGKAIRRHIKTKTVVRNKSNEMEFKKNYLVPGQHVSVDKLQSAIPGQFYNSKGLTDDKDMFHGSCIFVDHESGYIQVWHQVTFNANDTVNSKLLYKRDA